MKTAMSGSAVDVVLAAEAQLAYDATVGTVVHIPHTLPSYYVPRLNRVAWLDAGFSHVASERCSCVISTDTQVPACAKDR